MPYINLFGSIVTVWSILRMKNPIPVNGLFDSFARFIFSTWMLVYYFQGNTTLLLLFFIPEIIWGIVQSYGYVSIDKTETQSLLKS